MGLTVSRSPAQQNENGISPTESTGGEEEEEEVKLHAKAVYAFSGTNEDEVCTCVYRRMYYVCAIHVHVYVCVHACMHVYMWINE